MHVRQGQGGHRGPPLQFRNLLLDEIDHHGFDLDPIQTVDPWNSAGAETVDFYHFITDDVNPYKEEALFSQAVPDDVADGAIVIGNVMFIGPCARMDIGSKIPFEIGRASCRERV